MDFLILRPLPPKTGYHFFGGGWGGGGGGWGVGGGGQKFLLNRLQAVRTHGAGNTVSGAMVTQPIPDVQACVRTPVCRILAPPPMKVLTAGHTNAGRLRYHSATTWIPAKGLPAAWGRICY